MSSEDDAPQLVMSRSGNSDKNCTTGARAMRWSPPRSNKRRKPTTSLAADEKGNAKKPGARTVTKTLNVENASSNSRQGQIHVQVAGNLDGSSDPLSDSSLRKVRKERKKVESARTNLEVKRAVAAWRRREEACIKADIEKMAKDGARCGNSVGATTPAKHMMRTYVKAAKAGRKTIAADCSALTAHAKVKDAEARLLEVEGGGKKYLDEDAWAKVRAKREEAEALRGKAKADGLSWRGVRDYPPAPQDH